MRRMLVVAALTTCAAAPCAAQEALARRFDPATPWYVEGAVGTFQPGPDGTRLGNGQNYEAHFGALLSDRVDLGLGLAWSDARSSSRALETHVTSGGLRARAWVTMGRWSPFAEVGARLYHLDIQEQGVTRSSAGDRTLHLGGPLGAGVLYSRSTWWAGLGTQVHLVPGSVALEGGDLLTYTTYQLVLGMPLGR